MSAHGPALPLPRPLPDSQTAIRLGVPLLAALVLGVAVGTDQPRLAVLALLPFAAAIALNPRGATLAFAFCFYLNAPVLLMDRALTRMRALRGGQVRWGTDASSRPGTGG